MELVGADPAGAIPADDAIAAARKEYGFDIETSAAAFLQRVTNSAGVRGLGGGLKDRPVWIVRFSGLSEYMPGPMTESGVPAPGHTLHYAYVFLDAKTGSFLLTDWRE